MLEFVLFLLGGIGYGFYFDLNPARNRAWRCSPILCVWRGWLPKIPRRAHLAAIVSAARSSRNAPWPPCSWRRSRFARPSSPRFPVPKPVITDEFSHLLIADTLSHGRLD